ncbi:Uma2 family endonuclease [Caloramator sp. E03]|uniref:Uma2 family endonuclease n=1 Tax=Caloramator sp. E03 TaxID=2576307 RepID=UPI001110AB43|nr:Uma2 family endonuclease [Caloramator sp. E03]QCX33506.1 Uma2 family endonuclease [Caloramator sp. E03]
MPLINPSPITYKDYINMNVKDTLEVIDGIPYNMSPSPSRIHQKIIIELVTLINNHLKLNNMPCEVYSSPLDVIFINENEDIYSSRNIVQPDILVICDKNKLSDKGIIGSPDFIIEIVSPSSAALDYIKKLNLYNQYKVKEYWIINPATLKILVYKLMENNEYGQPEQFTFDDIVKLDLLNLTIDFNLIKEVL